MFTQTKAVPRELRDEPKQQLQRSTSGLNFAVRYGSGRGNINSHIVVRNSERVSKKLTTHSFNLKFSGRTPALPPGVAYSLLLLFTCLAVVFQLSTVNTTALVYYYKYEQLVSGDYSKQSISPKLSIKCYAI